MSRKYSRVIMCLLLAAFFATASVTSSLGTDEGGEINPEYTTSSGEEKRGPAPPLDESVEIQRGGMVLLPGTYVIEPGIEYSHTSRARIALSGFSVLQAVLIGSVVTEDIKKDIVMPFLNFRFGISNDLQGDIKIPYLWRKDREAYTDQARLTEHTVSDHNVGDIEVGIGYHALYETESAPDIVFNLRWKSMTGEDPYDLQTRSDGRYEELPSGNGHYGVSTGLTMVKRSDPAVYYANFNYFYNFERDIGGNYGKVKPGNSYEYSFGFAYALNEQFSTSFGYSQRLYEKTEQDGRSVIGSDINVSSLTVGANHSFNDQISLNFSVDVGLTTDAPDVSISIRLPIKF